MYSGLVSAQQQALGQNNKTTRNLEDSEARDEMECEREKRGRQHGGTGVL